MNFFSVGKDIDIVGSDEISLEVLRYPIAILLAEISRLTGE